MPHTPLVGLDINLYDLAATVKRLIGSTSKRIELILSRADEKIRPAPTNLSEFVEDLCYDETFLALAGIPYASPDSRLIKAGIADYLLRQEK